MGDQANSYTKPANKVYGVTSIKTFVPIFLDLERLNCDTWREMFKTHCIDFDAFNHINDSEPKVC